jgi:hypothetical protein
MANGRKRSGRLVAAALLMGAAASAHAQWSIGAAGPRTAPQGKNRYAFFVLTNPIAGHEAEFNDWYNMRHLGDLLQLDGWTGAQRFRLADGMKRDQDTPRYRFGYLTQWDWEGNDVGVLFGEAGKAIRGGKSRLGAAFNYAPGASINVIYQALTARLLRADGKGNTIPAPEDNTTPRANRYLFAEFVQPAQGQDDTTFLATMKARVPQVLRLTGWNAAQIFRYQPLTGMPGAPATPPLASFVTIWEIEAPSAMAAADQLEEAEHGGTVKPLAIDRTASQLLYWEPVGPYITKDLFER